MPLLLQCFEPQGQPIRTVLTLDVGERFQVYLLQDSMATGTRGLRDTILCRHEQHPPSGASLLLEAEVRPAREGERHTLRVHRIGRRVVIDQIRPDLRSRLTTSSSFKSGTRFEATLPDLRTISFSLEIQAQVAQGAAASASGSSARRGAAAASAMSLLWVVPTAMSTMADPFARVVTTFAMMGKRFGISPAMFSPMLIMSALTVGIGYFAYMQYESADEAEARAAAAEEHALAAEAGRDAALVAEAHCVSERKELVAELDMIDEARALMAEEVLAASLSRSKSVEIGGAVLGQEATLEFDTQFTQNVISGVVIEMDALGPPPRNARRCLEMAQSLGPDLPQYLLLWHPDPELVCPEDYQAVQDGVARAGSWGLSSRARDEFGSADETAFGDAEGFVTDPRMNDRWSSAAMISGFRSIQKALLTTDIGDRPQVAPGQAQLWTLAVWDAYNRMPSPANGVLNKPFDECIQKWVREVARASMPAEEGQPALPDIAAVAAGQEVPVTATVGCPWTPGAVPLGAKSAMRAAAHRANLLMIAEEEG